jgi:hypothetical protein
MKRAATKYSLLFVLACCLGGCGGNVEKSTAAKSQESTTVPKEQPGLGQPTARFVMPPPNPIDPTKPIKCKAIATMFWIDRPWTHEEWGKWSPNSDKKLGAHVEKGTDKLNLWLEGQTLLVQTGHNEKPGRWRVTAHYSKRLVATAPSDGAIPTSYVIYLDENNGFAVWSLTPFTILSEYPASQTVYLACINTVE